jgi:RNA polymerase sigma-70 factor (ECF subfamily)
MSIDSDASPPVSTDELIQRCLRGDDAAWEEVVRRHWRKVFNLAYKFVARHDEAEDLAQDIFFKVFRSLATFDRRADFQTWLISVGRNLCIDHYRRVRRERDTIDPNREAAAVTVASPSPGPLALSEQQERRALLRRALDELAPPLREAVLLRDLRELSYQEIAERLALPEGTVKSRINRGRHELARQIRRMEHAHRTPSTAAGHPLGVHE